MEGIGKEYHFTGVSIDTAVNGYVVNVSFKNEQMENDAYGKKRTDYAKLRRASVVKRFVALDYASVADIIRSALEHNA